MSEFEVEVGSSAPDFKLPSNTNARSLFPIIAVKRSFCFSCASTTEFSTDRISSLGAQER
jgi:hypothetical protein